MSKKRATPLHAPEASSRTVGFVGCASQDPQSPSTDPLRESLVNLAPLEIAPAVVPDGQPFALGRLGRQTLTLGGVEQVVIALTAGPSYSGTVRVSFDRAGLAASDPEGNVAASALVMSEYALEPGQTRTVLIKLEASTMSRSFSGGELRIVATDASDASKYSESLVPIAVSPVYVVKFTGGASHSDAGSDPVSFRSHGSGVRLRFQNFDRGSIHAVQGSGVVPSQTGSLVPAGLDGWVAAGGSYETVVMVAGPIQGSWRCPHHESGWHVLNFNSL